MALRNGQGQRKKYLTLELSSASNLVEDMGAIVSEFQSAKIGGDWIYHRPKGIRSQHPRGCSRDHHQLCPRPPDRGEIRPPAKAATMGKSPRVHPPCHRGSYE